jgi:LysM repeat protein
LRLEAWWLSIPDFTLILIEIFEKPMAVMKPTMFFATLAMLLASPASFGKTELEALRDLCAEQERQIQQLELENSRLRDTPPPSRAALQSGVQLISTSPARPAVPQNASAAPPIYTVKPGDSLAKISRNTGVPAATLAKLNGLKADSMLHPNQKLKLPGSPVSAATSTQSPASSSPRPSAATYKVQAGDTYFSIAKKHGLSTEALIAANPDTKPSALRPGQLVKLTAAASSPAPAPSAPAPAVSESLPVSTAASATKVAESPPQAPAPEKKIRPIMIEGEMTFGDFAAKHGTNTERLNALNGLDLTTATVLAKGSELYVPAQP